ncbi:MAG: hypothetical protein Q4A00_04020 [Flavobacteriaceae bacterium]|nr:hypothetical protein [Flavobacteriaceae bacterium]
MEFNIALNTVVYIMIFIFPGIIFRKFYYIKEYSKEFDKGNLFERVIWTIFISVIMLIISYSTYILLVDFLEYKPLSYISYTSIKETYEVLSKNEFPKEYNNNVYKHFLYLIIYIYTLSATCGYVWHSITKSFLFRKSGFFKKINYWEDLTKGTYYNVGNDSLTHAYTTADVLIDTPDGNKLYSGKLENYYLNHDTNQLQTIILSDVTRYKKEEKETLIKNVPGHHFVIEKDKILNLNFTYIFEDKNKAIWYKRLNYFLNALSTIVFVGAILSLFFSINAVYTSTILRKFFFLVCSLIIILSIKDILKYCLSGQWSKLKIEFLWVVILFSLPFLWIYNILEWYIVLGGNIFLFFIFSFINQKKDKNTAK